MDMDERLEMHKEAVTRYLEDDLTRNQEEYDNAEKEREELEAIIDINDRESNVLYQRNAERIEKASGVIANTKEAAKYSLEQVIKILKEKNEEIAENYMSKKPGEIQLEINRLKTENQGLESDILHKEQVILETQELISKYSEIGDIERRTELENKVQSLKEDVSKKKEKLGINLKKLDKCLNYEKEYMENTKLIKEYREKAKTFGIELEETKSEKTKSEKTKPEETSTKSPKTETKVPKTETKAPKTETKAPKTETKAPKTETKAPEVETKAPETGTKAPKTAAKPPKTAAKPPKTATKAPEVEIKTPETEIEVPEVEMKAPETEMEVPEVETKAPETEMEAPEVEIKAPETEMEASKEDVEARIISAMIEKGMERSRTGLSIHDDDIVFDFEDIDSASGVAIDDKKPKTAERDDIVVATEIYVHPIEGILVKGYKFKDLILASDGKYEIPEGKEEELLTEILTNEQLVKSLSNESVKAKLDGRVKESLKNFDLELSIEELGEQGADLNIVYSLAYLGNLDELREYISSIIDKNYDKELIFSTEYDMRGIYDSGLSMDKIKEFRKLAKIADKRLYPSNVKQDSLLTRFKGNIKLRFSKFKEILRLAAGYTDEELTSEEGEVPEKEEKTEIDEKQPRTTPREALFGTQEPTPLDYEKAVGALKEGPREVDLGLDDDFGPVFDDDDEEIDFGGY